MKFYCLGFKFYWFETANQLFGGKNYIIPRRGLNNFKLYCRILNVVKSRSHWIEFYCIHIHRCPCGSKYVYWCNLPIKKFAKFLPEMQFNCRLTLVGDRKGLANLVKHALVGLVPNFIALLSWPQIELIRICNMFSYFFHHFSIPEYQKFSH